MGMLMERGGQEGSVGSPTVPLWGCALHRAALQQGGSTSKGGDEDAKSHGDLQRNRVFPMEMSPLEQSCCKRCQV